MLATTFVLTACPSSTREGSGPSTAAPRALRNDEIAIYAGDSNIFVLAADGTSPRRITSGPEFDTQPDWSPDRRRLVFIRGDSPRDSGHVMVVNRDGTELAQLTTDEGSFWDAVWSPDGRRIAVTKRDSDANRVYVMDADGSRLTRLVEIESTSPSWSPDGRFLLFAGNPRGGEADRIYRLDVQAGRISVLVAAPETLNQSPVWSPDGRRIAFIRIRIGEFGGQSYTLGTDLYIMDPGGTMLRHIPAADQPSSPTWSLDSQQVLIVDQREAAVRSELFTVDPNNGSSGPLRDQPVRGFDQTGPRGSSPEPASWGGGHR